MKNSTHWPILAILFAASVTSWSADPTRSGEPPPVLWLTPPSKTLEESVDQSLTWLKSLHFTQTTPLYKQFFGTDLTGEALIAYLSVAKKFYYRPEVNNWIAGAIKLGGQLPTMVFTDQFLTLPEEASVLRHSILIHEAYHLRNADGEHVKCPLLSVTGKELIGEIRKAPLNGEYACDSSYDRSYGVQVVLLRNISKYCVNCSQDEKLEAAHWADSLMLRIDDLESFNVLLNDH